MFFTEDHELIRRIIDNKDFNKILIPLYVKIFNRTYGITELDDITDFSKFSFKVGFGSKNNMTFPKSNNFPLGQLQCFYNPTLINYFDEETQLHTTYVVFESDVINEDERRDIELRLIYEVNEYVSLLSNYIESHVAKLKRERIQEMLNQYSIDSDS